MRADRVAGASVVFRALSPLDPPRWPKSLVVGVAAALASGGLRWALGGVLFTETPYITYFAGVLFASLWGGILGGCVCILLCVGLAWVFFTHFHPEGLEPRHLTSLAVFVAMSAFIVGLAHATANALRREALMKERVSLVGQELQHRLKNGLTLAIAIVRQSAKTASSAPALEAAVIERFEALGRVQSLIGVDPGERLSLGEVLARVLAPYTGVQIPNLGQRPPTVTSQTSVALSLVFNELGTNALKYGALSQSGGRVALGFRMEDDWVVLNWKETGGPRVTPPVTQGFGSRLFRSALPGGAVKVAYEEDGVACEVRFKAR